jgi:hypothetical protein
MQEQYSMTTKCLLLFLLNSIFFSLLSAQTDTSSVTWIFDRVDTIGGYPVTPWTTSPTIIETSQGKAAFFNGINNGMLLNCNPIGSATEFTLEVVFKPDSNTVPNNQPRFLHIRRLADNNRRITMETRILPDQSWVLDTYIRSEISQYTQLDSSQTHTSGIWHHAAIVYGAHSMKQYVDGVLQLSDTVTYLPIDTGPTIYIGVRQDKFYYFKGAIRLIKASKRVLAPEEFTLPTITEAQDIGERPVKNNLFQNFPNPFNPNTNFIYQLKKEELVSVKIYNVLGQEVATLVNEIKPAGRYNTAWNASAFGSGVYFCKMESKSFVSTMKLLLVK